MKELRQRQIVKQRLYSTPALVVFTLITIFLVHGTYGVLKKEFESSSKVKALNQNKETLLNRQGELKDSIESIQTDEGIEKEIKEKFNVSKAGEHVVVLVDPKPIATNTPQIVSPWYKRLWDSIIGD